MLVCGLGYKMLIRDQPLWKERKSLVATPAGPTLGQYEGNSGVRTARQSVPQPEEMGSLSSFALLGQQYRLLWEEHDFEWGSSLLLRQILKSGAVGWGRGLQTPLPAARQQILPWGEMWVAHLSDRLRGSHSSGLQQLLAWEHCLF